MDKKEILNKIKKAKWIFVNVRLSEDTEAYIEVKRPDLKRALFNQPFGLNPELKQDLDSDKFVLREDGDLYIN